MRKNKWGRWDLTLEEVSAAIDEMHDLGRSDRYDKLNGYSKDTLHALCAMLKVQCPWSRQDRITAIMSAL